MRIIAILLTLTLLYGCAKPGGGPTAGGGNSPTRTKRNPGSASTPAPDPTPPFSGVHADAIAVGAAYVTGTKFKAQTSVTVPNMAGVQSGHGVIIRATAF